MITSACIYIPSTGPAPLAVLGGLSLLKRAVLTAQRAGATMCYLATAFEPAEKHLRQAELQRDLDGDKRLNIQIIWVQPGDALSPQQSCSQTAAPQRCLYYALTTLFSPHIARELDQAAQPSETVGIKVDSDVHALVLGPLPGAGCEPLIAEAALTAVSSGSATESQIPIRTIPDSGPALCQLTDATDLHRAESALLSSLDNPKDGFVDTYLNRKLSRPLTQLLLRTPLSPNQITLLSCLIGLFGATYFFQAGYWGPILGALLLQFSAIVDCCDGEVARMKFLESPLGAWLDISLDTVVHIATFAGLGFAVWAQGGTSSPFLLGGLLIGGTILSFACVVVAERTPVPDAQQQTWQNMLLHRLVSGLASRDYSLLILVCAVLQQLAWFLWIAAVGVHVFWLTLALLLYYTRQHSRQLKRAAHFSARSSIQQSVPRLP